MEGPSTQNRIFLQTDACLDLKRNHIHNQASIGGGENHPNKELPHQRRGRIASWISISTCQIASWISINKCQIASQKRPPIVPIGVPIGFQVTQVVEGNSRQRFVFPFLSLLTSLWIMIALCIPLIWQHQPIFATTDQQLAGYNRWCIFRLSRLLVYPFPSVGSPHLSRKASNWWLEQNKVDHTSTRETSTWASREHSAATWSQPFHSIIMMKF